jgi:flagellin-like hook-associated protein FlgL
MKDTEVLLREQLRNLIQGNANLEDIQKMVNNIKTKLDEIEKILE